MTIQRSQHLRSLESSFRSYQIHKLKSEKDSLVKDEKLRQQAIRRVLECAQGLGFQQFGLVETDVEEGEKKNIEYLLLVKKRNN